MTSPQFLNKKMSISTSSFTTASRNNACFALMNGKSMESGNCIIVSSSCTKHFGIDKVYEYIQDIMTIKRVPIMGTHKLNNGDIIVVLNNAKKYYYIFTATVIRYAWEGTVGNKKPTSDYFYKIIEHYFKIKSFKITDNVLERICLAQNCFLIDNDFLPNIRTGHSISERKGCKIVNELPKESISMGQVHSTFNLESSLKSQIEFKKPKLWSIKNYQNLYKQIKKLK